MNLQFVSLLPQPCLHCLVFIALIVTTAVAPAEDSSESIPFHNPRRLSDARISCERIPLGKPDDYKPCIAKLPSGELLLTTFHQHKRDGDNVMEQTLLFRSPDAGRTWTGPQPLGVRAIIGTETDDGFEFDFAHDRIMLDTKTPVGTPQGGGFGLTVQLDDGKLVTSYSLVAAHRANRRDRPQRIRLGTPLTALF